MDCRWVTINPAESLGDPYLRHVTLPRIPNNRDLCSRRYPKDTFPSKLSVKPQWQAGTAAIRLSTAAARLSTAALRHTVRICVLQAIGNIPVQ